MTDEKIKGNTPDDDELSLEDVDKFIKTVKPVLPFLQSLMIDGSNQALTKWKMMYWFRVTFTTILTIAILGFAGLLIADKQTATGISILTHSFAVLAGAMLSVFNQRSG